MRDSEKKRRNWYRRRWRNEQRRQQTELTLKTMKIGFWNANGLQCSVKKQTVVEALETQELSVLGLVETNI